MTLLLIDMMRLITMTSRVIKFWAPWCGPCNRIGQVLEEKGITLQSHSVDDEPALAGKYGVMQVPTFIAVDEEGRELKRLTESDAAEVLEFIKKWEI